MQLSQGYSNQPKRRLGSFYRSIFFAALIPVSGYSQTRLVGGGATFPYPIYARWIAEYQKIHPDVEIRYDALGSGAGIREVTAGVFDFAGSDAPMDDAELDEYRAKRGVGILHFPTVIGAAVPIYNIPGVGVELKFTPEALVGIYAREPGLFLHFEGVSCLMVADLEAKKIMDSSKCFRIVGCYS